MKLSALNPFRKGGSPDLGDGRGIVITRDWCTVLLALYAASVFVWDYTIGYQAALVVMLAFTVALYRGRILRLSPYVASSGLFLLYFLVHTCVGLTVDVKSSTDYLVTLCINMAAAMCILCIVDSRRKIEIVMKVLICTAVALWVYIIIADRQNLLSHQLGAKIQKPIFGGVYAHNNLPMFAGYAVLFLTYFRLKRRPLPFTWALYAFFLICVLLASARKALLFTLFGLLVYPLLFSKKTERFSNRTIKLAGLVIGVCVAFYLVMTNATLYELIGYRFDGLISGLLEGSFTESSARSRSVMIATALDSIHDHFLLGIGLNTFRTLEGSYGTWSHNNFLEIMVSGGILPLLIYYAFPVYAFVKLRRIRKDPMAGMFMTYMIYVVIHDLLSISYNARNMGLMMCLISAYLSLQEKEKRKRQREFHDVGTLLQGVLKA